MPAVGFTKAGVEEGKLSFEEAPGWYEKNTEIPPEAIRLLINLEGDPRRRGINISPSSASEQTTCVRQLAIKKFVPYLINGVQEWQATEGTVWHEAFASAGLQREDGYAPEDVPHIEDDYYREVLLPDFVYNRYSDPSRWPELVSTDTVRKFEYVPGVHSSWEVQIFPGIWMNGRVDKLKKDFSRIEDFKTKAYPGWKDRKTGQWKVKHYPPKKEVAIQLNLYRRMVEVVTGVNPAELVVRQMYRGSRSATHSWKLWDIEVMSNDELEATIRPFVERAVASLSAVKEAEEQGGTSAALKVINTLPLDGHERGMFNGMKCPDYCSQMPICFKLAGMVRFDTKPGETQVVDE